MTLLWNFSFCRRTVNHLWQVLLFARRLFYRIESSNAVNQEAAVLWVFTHDLKKIVFWETMRKLELTHIIFLSRHNNDCEAYKAKVVENINHCQEQLCNSIDDDPHSIKYV